MRTHDTSTSSARREYHAWRLSRDPQGEPDFVADEDFTGWPDDPLPPPDPRLVDEMIGWMLDGQGDERAARRLFGDGPVDRYLERTR